LGAVRRSRCKTIFSAKKVLDRLAHGEHIEESELPVETAKTLALKLLGTKET